MSRPVLHFAIQRSSYSSMFNVMRVTRITGLRIYGSIDSVSTHCKPDQVYGKFDNELDAKKACERVAGEYRRFQGAIDNLTNSVQRLMNDREYAINQKLEAINGNAS